MKLRSSSSRTSKKDYDIKRLPLDSSTLEKSDDKTFYSKMRYDFIDKNIQRLIYESAITCNGLVKELKLY